MISPPMPDEWHPFYVPYGFLREALSNTKQRTVDIVIFKPPVFEYTEYTPVVELTEIPVPDMGERITLHRTTAVAPAPWTGRHYLYTWPILTDHLGRSVAGPATRVDRQGVTPWEPGKSAHAGYGEPPA